jgi:hypothetical protein
MVTNVILRSIVLARKTVNAKENANAKKNVLNAKKRLSVLFQQLRSHAAKTIPLVDVASQVAEIPVMIASVVVLAVVVVLVVVVVTTDAANLHATMEIVDATTVVVDATTAVVDAMTATVVVTSHVAAVHHAASLLAKMILPITPLTRW